MLHLHGSIMALYMGPPSPLRLHFVKADAGVQTSTLVPPQLLLMRPIGTSPLGESSVEISRPKSQHTALKAAAPDGR